MHVSPGAKRAPARTRACNAIRNAFVPESGRRDERQLAGTRVSARATASATNAPMTLLA